MKEHKSEYKPAERIELDTFPEKEPKKFVQITCPSCKSGIGSDNIELQKEIAKCGSCNAIFSISEEVNSIEQEKEKRQEFLRPEGIELFFFKDEMDITIDDHMGVGEQCLQFFHFLTLGTGFFYFFGEKPISLLLLVSFVLLSIYLVYRAATYSHKHKTFIEINKDELNIRSRPSNYFTKDKRYSASDIDQIYLKSDPNGSGQITLFALVNHPNGQKHEKLCLASNISKAKYLEQEIENYLGVKDRNIPGSNV